MHDYVPGKQDWLQAGLPSEGALASDTRAGTVCRTDAPACRVDEPLADVRGRVRGAGWDTAVVTTESGVVLGLLRESDLSEDGPTAGDAMLEGPSTFRANVSIEEMAEHMVEHDVESAPITRPEGTLIGLLLRDDAVRVAHEAHPGHDGDRSDGDG